MASITPQNGRVNFVASYDPHCYWEINSTNLGTNFGDDTTGVDDNTSITSGLLSTQQSYEGLNSQADPPGSSWFDLYVVTDAAMLIYIPSGLTVGTTYGLFHNGGGTHHQGAWLRATSTGVEIACSHTNAGTDSDILIEEIPNADLDGWHCIGFQYSQNGGNQGDQGLWLNGSLVRSATRNYELVYGSGDPDFGNNNGDEPDAIYVNDPASYTGGDWDGTNTAITGSGILIANFTCDNPTQSNTTSPGNGDQWYIDYYSEHTASAAVIPAITDVDTDEEIAVGQTGVVITGTDFETDGANSRVRIDSASNGTGTSQTQTDTSWGDTSIQFTVSTGSLNYGTNYLFVRNQSLQENATGYAVNIFIQHSTSGLNESSVYDGQASITVSGSNFGASQGTGKVYLCDSLDGSGTNVAQTVTNWATGSITFTINKGALSNGTVYVIVARNESTLGDTSERFSSNSQAITLIATPTPAVSSISDGDIQISETGVVISGADFLTPQGAGTVEFCASNSYVSPVAQTVTNWSDSSITINVVQGALSVGTVYTFITNSLGERNASGYAVTLSETGASPGLYKTAIMSEVLTSEGLDIIILLVSDE